MIRNDHIFTHKIKITVEREGGVLIGEVEQDFSEKVLELGNQGKVILDNTISKLSDRILNDIFQK